MNASSNSSHCPCDELVFPQMISNPPGRSSISYRVGDYVAFREALLRSTPGETELVNWRPGAEGDLAVQMVEWWAYLADILTFYNERIANEGYLQTATRLQSVQGLVRLLGYRPRPGIGATGTLAALLSGAKSVTLPQGFQIQSKPGPGQQPQIFELTAKTTVQPPDVLAAQPAASLDLLGTNQRSVLLSGVITSIKPFAELLLVPSGWKASNLSYAVAQVHDTAPQKGPNGKTNTRVTFQSAISVLAGTQVTDYLLQKSSQSSLIWQYFGLSRVLFDNGDGTCTVHLASISRQIQVGDAILFDGAGGSQPQVLAQVTAYQEVIYYANPGGSPPDPSVQPADPSAIPIPITHSVITFKPSVPFSSWSPNAATLLVRYNWQNVGTLIATPSTTLTGTGISLATLLPASLPLTGQEVLIGDAAGNGVEADASSSDGSNITLSNPGPADPTWDSTLAAMRLAAPLSVYFNLLAVTRGQTVANEILGSGDSTIAAGQEFVLKKSPLTYLQSASSTSGPDYSSTLEVWVDGVQWQEVQSFYNQGPGAQVFVTREDDQSKTHVQFGDGVNGARLPSGVNNVVATYRIGSGKQPPGPGSLTVVLKSWPGLKSVVNPVQAGGGADADLPADLQTNAPQSVLTFGRAISADDYEVTAVQAPGVARARVYWKWDANQQRNMVVVYVGDDQNALDSAMAALTQASDPNRPVSVYLAQATPISIGLTLIVDRRYVMDDVVAAVTAALIDPNQGLLGTDVVQIGQSLFQSQIYQACLAVTGVVAVQNLLVVGVAGQSCAACPDCDYRYDPGQGRFFCVSTSSTVPGLNISPEAASNVS
jgi:hypothetical protein